MPRSAQASAKMPAARAAGIHDDEATHANFQKDLWKQQTGWLIGMDVMDWNVDNKLS